MLINDLGVPSSFRTLRLKSSPIVSEILANASFSVAASRSVFFSPVPPFKTDGMVIIPCSTGTLGSIANGISRGLIERAADVVLKERRKLIIVPRETPLSLIHLKNMVKLTEAGGIVMPASPGFYHIPKSVDDLVDMVASRVLQHLEIESSIIKQWKG